MSRTPFDPSEVDGGLGPQDPAVEELERYATIANDHGPGDFADRVMSAVATEPTPRRGPLAWFVAPASSGRPFARFARVTALAATLVLAVAGALYAGDLARLVRDFGVGSTPRPSATESFEPSPSESPSPTPSVSPVESESQSPEPTGAPGSSAPAATPRPSTGQPSPTESEDESKSPTPSQTPEESDTPEPAST
jgi:hypothetical protein